MSGQFLTFVKAGLPPLDDKPIWIFPSASSPSKHLKREFGDFRRKLHFNGIRTWVLVEVDDSTELNINNLVKFWYLLIHRQDEELIKDARIILWHLYQTTSKDDQGSKAIAWRFLVERMKQELEGRFDADVFLYGIRRSNETAISRKPKRQ